MTTICTLLDMLSHCLAFAVDVVPHLEGLEMINHCLAFLVVQNNECSTDSSLAQEQTQVQLS